MRELAAAELSGAIDAGKDLAIADGWWDLAELKSTPKSDAIAIKLHAAVLYERGKGSTNGLALIAVESRLRQAAAIDPESDDPFFGKPWIAAPTFL